MSRTQKPPGQWTALGMLGSILGATACLVGCAAELSALGRPHTAPAGLLIGLAAGFGAGMIALIWVAVRLSRRLRAGRMAVPTTAAAGRAAVPTTAGGGSEAASRTPPVRLRRGAVLRILAIVALVAVILLVPATLYLHGQTVRTANTQHGLARRATVVTVLPDQHDTTYQSWTTYNYEVRLAAPAAGVTRTVAHDPTRDSQRFFAGDRVRVVVDPGQPGYAEFPGLPVAAPAWYLLAVVVLAVIAVLAVWIGWAGRRGRRGRREPGSAT
jgi:hypothetical protein